MRRAYLWLVAAGVCFNYANAQENESDEPIVEPVIIEDTFEENPIEEVFSKRVEGFVEQIESAVLVEVTDEGDPETDADDYTYESYDLKKAHRFVVADENMIQFASVDENLNSVADEIAENSTFLKSVTLDVDSNIGGQAHKNIVEYVGPGAAAWFPYNLNVDIGGELSEAASNPLGIGSVDIGFGAFQTAASGRVIAGLSYVNKVYFDFEVGVDSLTLLQKALNAEAAKASCQPELIELLSAKFSQVKPVLEKACEIAQDVVAASDFVELVKSSKPKFDELDEIVTEATNEVIEEQAQELAAIVKVASRISIHAETCERWSYGWWTYVLPEWNGGLDFGPNGCTPSVQIDLEGGIIAAGGNSALVISEDKIRVDVDVVVNDNSIGLITEDSLNEEKAEAMAYYWVAMKAAETLTPEEVEYGGQEMAELFDEAVKYLVENFVEDVQDEVEFNLD
jgi:hypothetical protein